MRLCTHCQRRHQRWEWCKVHISHALSNSCCCNACCGYRARPRTSSTLTMAAAWFSIVFLPAPAALTGNHHHLSHHHHHFADSFCCNLQLHLPQRCNIAALSELGLAISSICFNLFQSSTTTTSVTVISSMGFRSHCRA